MDSYGWLGNIETPYKNAKFCQMFCMRAFFGTSVVGRTSKTKLLRMVNDTMRVLGRTFSFGTFCLLILTNRMGNRVKTSS